MSSVKSKARLRLGLLAVAVVALVAVGLSVASFSNSDGRQIEVIRVGSTAPGHLVFTVSKHLHAWDREFAPDGIRIEYLPFTGGGSEAATALSSGNLEFMFTASNPALRAAASGADVKMVAVSSFARRGASSIIVRADSPIRSVADLKGKKVAYLAGTVRHASLVRVLQSVDLTIKDIQSLQLDAMASAPALLRGDIDALVEGEGTVWKLMQQKAVRVLVDGRNHPEWATPSVITVNGDFARRHPDLVRRFLAVDLQCAEWADAHPEETIRVLSKLNGQPVEYLRTYHPDGRFFAQPAITSEALQSLRDEEEFMRSTALLKGSIDHGTWVDRSYIDAVYAASGKGNASETVRVVSDQKAQASQ
ncbi:aliphatic sulfonates family ABC transporter, periplasmic ligand-binding protein [Rhodomicrobium vannielii ATCC 17100]|jgi:sulfonate transport system substrate-binding protein|uniref:Aliphatic sulfonates family ABC transporter, periplasmic ligand-binding protein n=1 Tax=Rhodomicrobium vannielii (strain ATCC 17100 / DSM 162 / LMG 4299 / NCIMB 10020 / ATH 3.1.1) TaxID=648757 RepID=E3I4W5_RHOVT|nr:aliphatic sulfonate ABC transporter substrate-binding protein [Rhodomicrobium vannielii]ADP72787.1 aliphatic sulfonates family ABC transporter, periplasmic ligand-binding protein [Rhodomicrobium vannielii ATCC 17100]